MSHMMDYLVRGGGKVELLKAQLEHMGGALEREIELGQKATAENARLRIAIRAAHYALTKSSLTADERVFDATAALARTFEQTLREKEE